MKVQGTRLCMSLAYHPQSDGQMEVVNKVLEKYLRCFVFQQPSSWSKWLDWVEFWYNTCVHSSTGVTPFEALYGKPPPTLLTYVSDTTRMAAVDQELRS